MASIDIVIPSAGRTADLLRLLASLHEHCHRSLSEHVVSITVSDDRPSVATAQAVEVRFPAVHYVPGPARGPAANRNHGAAGGGAGWILFLDDDCYTEVDLVAAYVQAVADGPQNHAFDGAIRAEGARPNGNHHAPLNSEGGAFWTCNVMVRRSAFEAVDGFDEDFPFACLEDCDLRERLLASGVRPAFVAGAAVVHPWRSISEREVSRAIVSHAIYGEKHRDFVAGFGVLNVLRALRGRLRLYATGRFSSIPLAKYRTVAYDLTAPVLVFLVLRVRPLRRALAARHMRSQRA